MPPKIATENFVSTPEFERAIDLLENSKQNVFISGKAGTGKSTFLEKFRSTTKKNIAVVAPTGVAALNVRGQTIHSFFKIKTGLLDMANFKPARNQKLYSNIDLLIIDEISMVRADLFDGIEAVLRRNNDRSLPFGGVQICVIGDLFQLPPVITPDEKESYILSYTSPFFFASSNYQEANFELIKFDTVFRQADNDFVKILNKIRIGRSTPDIIDYINQRHLNDFSFKNTPITLATTNAIADTLNQKQLSSLAGKTFTFKGQTNGDFAVDRGRLPSPEKLELKVGAQVMFTRNDVLKKRWVNGTIGTVTYVDDENIEVTILNPSGRKKSLVIEPEKWVTYQYVYNEEKEKLEQKETGSYTQFPLMLAWAITIHKSQGKTLENVIIDLGNGAFAPGQVYVALSRCRNYESLVLKKAVRPRDIWCDKTIIDFAKTLMASQQAS